MIDVVIGNVCCLLACISDSISGTRKTKKEILIAQSISQLFYIASSLILKAYSAVVQNVVAIFRNIYSISDKKSKILEWTLNISQVVFGLYFNNRGLLGIVPVIANLEYSLALFTLRNNPKGIKIAFAINALMFAFFNFAILNFVGGISCAIVVITTIISIYKESNNK